MDVLTAVRVSRIVGNNCGTGSGGFQPGNTCAKGGDGGNQGANASGGPWESQNSIRAHAEKMVEAYKSSPKARFLEDVRAQRQRVYDDADAKVKSAVTEEEKWEAIAERTRAKSSLGQVDEDLAKESRRVMLESFSVPDEEQAEVEVEFARSSKVVRDNFVESQEYLKQLSTKEGAAHGVAVTVASTRERANYDPARETIFMAKDDGPEIGAHEFGHHLELQPGIKERVTEFRERRFDSKDDVNLAEKFPDKGYNSHERGNADKMLDTFRGDGNLAAYTGRVHGGGMTEIVSMGLQKLYQDPVHFAKVDPEYFSLVVGVLQGVKK